MKTRAPRRRLRVRVVTPRGPSMTVDVSRGGFSTNVMRVLPPNTLFEGTIHYDGRDEAFTGRVVWARPGNPRLSMIGAMGVRFEAISHAMAMAIAGPETAQVQ